MRQILTVAFAASLWLAMIKMVAAAIRFEREQRRALQEWAPRRHVDPVNGLARLDRRQRAHTKAGS